MQRQCEILGIEEVQELEPWMDFRLPEYRREVFLRFYEFHTKHNSHPGAVYYAFPYLFDFFGMDAEQKLWFCYLNGLCQNVLTTTKLFCTFPSFKKTADNSGGYRDDFFKYFRDNYLKFGWDTDRRYVKNQFEKCVLSYIETVKGEQESFFQRGGGKYENFNSLWDDVTGKFYLFGRLSAFSYLEYLRLAGINLDCDSLMLADINGSKSHRNGLCKVLGRDDLDWHDKYNPGFEGKYSAELLAWLEREGEILLNEAAARFPGTTYFTLESTLCCYKSWHRPNRRYPNVYNDMFYQRILNDEKAWGYPNKLFRQLRKDCLPVNLRVEDVPGDPGLKPEKQNYYLNTGKVIMMDAEWPVFKNNFNDGINSKQNEGLFTNGFMRNG